MTKKAKVVETIRVVIPYKGKMVDVDKYKDNTKCYLATELKHLGYKDVRVGGRGYTFIGKDIYYPTKEFGYDILELAFKQAENVEVILRKLSKKDEN